MTDRLTTPTPATPGRASIDLRVAGRHCARLFEGGRYLELVHQRQRVVVDLWASAEAGRVVLWGEEGIEL